MGIFSSDEKEEYWEMVNEIEQLRKDNETLLDKIAKLEKENKELNENLIDLSNLLKEANGNHTDSGLERDKALTAEYGISEGLSELNGQAVYLWHCPKCQQQVRENDNYCHECGQRIKVEETNMSVIKSCVKCKDCYVLDYGTVCACLDEMISRDVDINKEVYSKCPKVETGASDKYCKEIRDKTVDLLAELCI